MLSLNLQDVQLHLRSLKDSEVEPVTGMIEVLTSILNIRYGDKITPENSGVFTFYVAQAIKRMLQKPDQTVIRQAMEGASVEYAAHSTKGDLFLASELSQMDALTGKRSTNIIRATSPKILNY